MSRFDEQGELALARPPRQPGIPPELVRAAVVGAQLAWEFERLGLV